MNHKIFLPLVALLLAVTACNIPTVVSTPTATIAAISTETALPSTATVPNIATPTNTPVTPAPTGTATATPVSSELTLDMLKNGTYHAPSYDRTVTLVNGSFTTGSSSDPYNVRMLDVVAFGDLNGDGAGDAAILLAENGGGSGVFESVIAVTNQAGKPHQQSQAELGDRVLINSIDISSGVIHLGMLTHGPNDPSCCPALPQKQNYWLIDNRLWLMRVTSTTGGTEHVINVDSPGVWTTNSNPFTVKGSLSVLPFENTLAYRIYLTDGTKVNESNLTVTPSGGIAGTFARDFDLSSAGITDWVIIQFIDISAADGSTIALGSVILKAK